MIEVLMDIYDCIKPVTYGRIDYTPNAEEEKSRIIKLPKDTPVDSVISECFKKRVSKMQDKSKTENATIMSKDEVINRLPDPITTVPESIEDKEKSFRKKFEQNGFHCDKRWNLDTLKSKFDEAMKKKEEEDNAE